MITENPTTTLQKPPHISFTAYPLGAWFLCLIGAGLFTLNSPHPERMSIMQILIAASMVISTVGGTLYVLALMALKRYPRFWQSFGFGFIAAAICVAVGFVTQTPKFALLMGCVFLLISGILPFFLKKHHPQ